MKNKMSGYRTIITLLLSWWFAAEIPHEIPGAFIRVTVGPFASEEVCERYRDELQTQMGFTGGRITPECVKREDI